MAAPPGDEIPLRTLRFNPFAALAHGFRQLGRDPGHSTLAVLTLALGIGLTAAMFAIVEGTFLRGLPFPDGERIVRVERLAGADADPASLFPFTAREAMALRGTQTSFDVLGAWCGFSLNLSGSGEPAEPHNAGYVTADLLAMTGVSPLLGRSLRPEDERAGAPPVVLLSGELWQSRFGGDRQVVGRSVRVAGEPATVIGVMPAGFRFPLNQYFWLPLRFDEAERKGYPLQMIGRLRAGRAGRAGMTPERARAEIGNLVRHLPSTIRRAQRPQDRRAAVPLRLRGRGPALPPAGDAGRRLRRPPHRLRQRGEPAPRARGGTGPRDRRPRRPRRRPGAPGLPAPRRDRGAGGRRRVARARPGRGADRPLPPPAGGRDPVVLGRRAARRAGAPLHLRPDLAGEPAGGDGSRPARRADRPGRDPQGRVAGEHRPAPRAVRRGTGGRRDRPLLRPAGPHRADRQEPREPGAARPRLPAGAGAHRRDLALRPGYERRGRGAATTPSWGAAWRRFPAPTAPPSSPACRSTAASIPPCRSPSRDLLRPRAPACRAPAGSASRPATSRSSASGASPGGQSGRRTARTRRRSRWSAAASPSASFRA